VVLSRDMPPIACMDFSDQENHTVDRANQRRRSVSSDGRVAYCLPSQARGTKFSKIRLLNATKLQCAATTSQAHVLVAGSSYVRWAPEVLFRRKFAAVASE
jgi:hypothetical protein